MRSREKREKKYVQGRLKFVRFTIAALFLGLAFNVGYIKKVNGEKYETSAKIQRVNSTDKTIAPNRGSILDRNKQTLAVSSTVYNVILDPLLLQEIDEKKTTETISETEKSIKALSECEELGVDYDTLKSYVSINPETNKPYVNSHYKIIAKKISRETMEKLSEQELKGVFFEKDTKRSYLAKTSACHVIGFVRGDAKWGLENKYDEDMSGVPGRKYTIYEDSQNAVTQEIEAQDGNTIVTTLDYTIQQYAEATVKRLVEEYNPENAGVVVTDPYTGEVYAMASDNIFNNNDPSIPVALETDPDFASRWESMSLDEQYKYLNSTWVNFNVSKTFEPGSTFKPVTVAAALEEGIIKPNETFYCPGSKTVYDRNIGCWLKTGHGELTLEDSLAESCNVAMMNIAERMGRSIFYKYQRDFGFGGKTGIDLPGEISEADLSVLMYSENRIGPVELATMSFGQSFNCTSIQAIMAFNACINGGKLMRPYVVSQVLDKSGTVVKENKPEVLRKVISQETSDIVRNYLKGTIEYGTGKKAKIEGYSIGAKTGTAQQGDRNKDIYTLSFVGFFPVENPQMSVFIVLDKPERYVDGETSPVAASKELMENIIRYKNIQPEYLENGQSVASSRSSETVTIDDFIGDSVNNAIIYLNNLNLNYKIVGTGSRVANQVPHAGNQVDEGTEVLIYAEKDENEQSGNVVVPNVVGKTLNEAIVMLYDEGFTAVTNGDEDGSVVSQNPLPGFSVGEGAEITINIEALEEENTEDQQTKNSE